MRQAGFPLYFCRRVIEHLKTQSLTQVLLQAAQDRLNRGSFSLLIFLFPHQDLPRESKRGQEVFMERSAMSLSCQGGGSCSSFQTCLNPSLGLLRSARPTGKLPWKHTPHFPSLFFILLQFFFIHITRLVLWCVGEEKKKQPKKGISRHK